jgi:hypothetical protein
MEASDFNHFVIVGKTEHGVNRFICTPENTELYLHHPDKYRDVDHMFHRIDERDRRLGAFVWRHVLGEETFEHYSDLMCASLNWIVHYRPTPTDSDMEQFATDFVDVPNELPNDWLE